MVRNSIFSVLATTLLAASLQAQNLQFGTSSLETMDRIHNIKNDFNIGKTLNGLAAAHNLRLNDSLTRGNIEAGEYFTAFNFINALDDNGRRQIRETIDELISADAGQGGIQLIREERGFWKDFNRMLGAGCGASGSGASTGDPHLITLDDYHYDLQTVGEFILSKSRMDSFQIQVRQRPWSSNNVAVNSAAAANLHGQIVSVYASDAPATNAGTRIWLNGSALTFGSRFLTLKNGGAIEKVSDDHYILYWETGQIASFNIYDYVDIQLTIPRNCGDSLVGLLGNNDGINTNDLFTADGIAIQTEKFTSETNDFINRGTGGAFANAERAYNEKLSRKFANSWRVNDMNSLFTYAPGSSTRDFTNLLYPSNFSSVGDLSADQVNAARRKCKDAGVSEANMAGCVYDVGFTGLDLFARSAGNIIKVNNTLQNWGLTKPINPVKPVDEAKKKVKKLFGF